VEYYLLGSIIDGYFSLHHECFRKSKNRIGRRAATEMEEKQTIGSTYMMKERRHSIYVGQE
jgi:hypothetical protein